MANDSADDGLFSPTSAGRPHAGLTVHSNLARSYAARDAHIGHAERTALHIQMAAALQAEHWAGVEEHLATRGPQGGY